MSDNYQAVYDAVRSRMSQCSIGDIVENAIGRPDIDLHFRNAANEIAFQMSRPSVIFRPVISMDGDSWCALLGENLAVGVAGFGDSPARAMEAFDAAFYANAKKVG